MSDTEEKLLMLSDLPVVNKASANEYSLIIAVQSGVKKPESIGFEDEFSLPDGRRTSPKEEISLIRKTGAGGAIQEIYDSKNGLFQMNVIDLGFSTFGASGLEITVSTKSPIAATGKPSRSMTHFHPLRQLSHDILKLREIVVQNSGSARNCLPFYSSYLTLCVAIVDCFINYCSKHLANGIIENGIGVTDYVGELFSRAARQERKLEVLWNTIFLNHNEEKDEYLTAICGFITEEIVDDRLKTGFSKLKSSNHWADYMTLKNARNLIVHPNEHLSQIYIEDIQNNLNRCRGLGELLLSFSRHQSCFGELGCLRQLAFAPKVCFSET